MEVSTVIAIPVCLVALFLGGWLLSTLFESLGLLDSDEARDFREAEEKHPK